MSGTEAQGPWGSTKAKIVTREAKTVTKEESLVDFRKAALVVVNQ